MATARRIALSLAPLLAFGACREKVAEVPQVPIVAADQEVSPPAPEGEPTTGNHLPAPAVGPAREQEPNDSREKACPLPLNGGLKGQLSLEGRADDAKPAKGRPSDEDWFVLTLDGATPQQVRIQLSPDETADLALQWMAGSGPVDKGSGTIATIDSARVGGVEVLPPTVLSPGRHFFRVVAAPRRKRQPQTLEGEYRLTTTVVDPEEPLEREPNETVKDATVLRPGEAREGYFGWPGDVDWYRLDLEGVPSEATVRVDLSAVQGVRGRLWMQDRQRHTLVQVPEASVTWPAGRPVTIRDVAIDTADLPYYVEVRGLRSSNPHDRYTLKATVETPQTAHEREPNWRPANATPLPPEQPVDGYIGHPTDWDVYRLESQEPRVATVVVSGVAGVDIQLELLDAGGKTIGTVNELGAGGPETYPLIQLGPESAFLRVTSRDRSFNVDQGYRIAGTYSEAGDRELEPNDDLAPSQRSTLMLGRPFEGNIHPRGDLDVWTLDVTTDGPDRTRDITLKLTGVEGLTLALELFDEARAPITRKGGVRAGDTRTITYAFATGRYLVRVKDESGQAANGTRAYTLEAVDASAGGDAPAPPQ